MAPIVHLLHQCGKPFQIVDLAQHAELTRKILDDFGIAQKPIKPLPQPTNISSYLQGVSWVLKHVVLLCQPGKLRKLLSPEGRDFALIHGDTASTFIGLLYAKRLGIATGLVEAGLTSGSVLSPFPEEFIRRTVERLSGTLFAPDGNAVNALLGKRLRGNIINTHYNTGRDALELIFPTQSNKREKTGTPYAICTLHRLETIGRASRLREIVRYLIDISAQLGKLKFVMHEPTHNALTRCNLLTDLTSSPNIEISKLCAYPDFIRLLYGAHWVLTDGGSVQEEASYFDKPCLILRTRTERPHGIGASARLATFDSTADAAFLRNAKTLPIVPATPMIASRIIVDSVQHQIKHIPGEVA